jgi:hypothetical protein
MTDLPAQQRSRDFRIAFQKHQPIDPKEEKMTEQNQKDKTNQPTHIHQTARDDASRRRHPLWSSGS